MPINNNKKFQNAQTATYIKAARAKLGLTQKALAERLGTYRANIAKYETGATMPPGNIILDIQYCIRNVPLTHKI